MTYRPMIPVFVFLSMGIVLNHFWKMALTGPLAVFVLFIFGVMFSRFRILALGMMILVAGYVVADHDTRRWVNDISLISFHHRDLAVQGIVMSDVEIRHVLKAQKTIFHFQIEKVLVDGQWRESKGRVMVNSFIDRPVMFGQRLILQGRLHQPFDFSDKNQSSYTDYLGRRHIQYILTSGKDDAIKILDESSFPEWRMMFRRWHADWSKVMDQYLLPGEAGIMTAMMTGDRSGIPPHIKKLFVETGTVHILAISGLNMAIIAAVFLGITQLLPMGFRLRMFVGLLMVIAYAIFTDGEASIVRSAIMAAVVLIGLMVEREQDGLNTLALSAVIILILDPWQLFDLGFQLTFLCVWTMIVIHPLFQDFLEMISKTFLKKRSSQITKSIKGFVENPMGRSVLESISISIAISIVVSGIIAYHFQIITPITVLANLMIVPMTTVLIVAGMALGFCGFFIPVLAPIAAVYVKIILNLMIVVIYGLRHFPGACFYIQSFSVVYLWMYFALLFVIIGVMKFKIFSRIRFS